MLLAASVPLLLCAATLSAPPALPIGAESTLDGATSRAMTSLPEGNTPSAFVDDFPDVTLRPLNVPTPAANAPPQEKTPPVPPSSRIRKTVSEWLTRGNRSEPATNFLHAFGRSRKLPVIHSW